MKDHGLLVEKYRPTNIDNYVGNESIKKSISNYISKNDIQNIIFYGPEGTGDRKSTCLNSIHSQQYRMPSYACK